MLSSNRNERVSCVGTFSVHYVKETEEFVNRFSFYALVIFFFSLPWQDIVKLPGGSVFSVSRLVGLALIVAGLGATFRRGTLRLRIPALTLVLTVSFVLWAGVGTLWNTVNPTSATLSATIYLQLAVMAILVWQLCRNVRDHRILLQAYVLGAYVVAGKIAFDYVTNPFVPNSSQSMERYAGIGDSPNGIAAAIALALPLAWFLGHFWARGLLRWVNYLYLPLAIFAIILTASRGGFLTALTGLMVVPLTFKHLGGGSRIAVIVFALLSAGFIASTIPIANFTRLTEASSEISDGDLTGRGSIWRAGLQLYTRSPVVGIGTGSFMSSVKPILGHGAPAHNAFLNILVELGVIGLGLYLANFLVVLRPLLRLPGPEKMFYLCFWLALVVSMIPSNVEDAQYVWGLLTLMATRQAYTIWLPSSGGEQVADTGRVARST